MNWKLKNPPTIAGANLGVSIFNRQSKIDNRRLPGRWRLCVGAPEGAQYEKERASKERRLHSWSAALGQEGWPSRTALDISYRILRPIGA